MNCIISKDTYSGLYYLLFRIRYKFFVFVAYLIEQFNEFLNIWCFNYFQNTKHVFIFK